jgi:hypothetical protein
LKHVESASVPEAEEWIRQRVVPAGPIQTVHVRPWSKVLRVPLTGRCAWFKACAEVQAFEPRLTADLYSRWPDRTPEVLGFDEERAWLLLADAGISMSALGNRPELWVEVLPLYGELQRGETAHVGAHLAQGVPDLRVTNLPERYRDLLRRELPLRREEVERFRSFTGRFAKLCDDLEAHGVPGSIQHDDLHMNNVYRNGDRLRLLDWGDSSISHPFASLVVTFRFLDEINHLPPADPWFTRLRDAYLEPWGPRRQETFELAMRVGVFAHAIAWARQREYLHQEQRIAFDTGFASVLRRALLRVRD